MHAQRQFRSPALKTKRGSLTYVYAQHHVLSTFDGSRARTEGSIERRADYMCTSHHSALTCSILLAMNERGGSGIAKCTTWMVGPRRQFDSALVLPSLGTCTPSLTVHVAPRCDPCSLYSARMWCDLAARPGLPRDVCQALNH